MVAVQVLLMNYFLLGLHTNHHLANDVLPGTTTHLANDVTAPDMDVDISCGYGCVQCSAVNGCLACKPPFYLTLQRDGALQSSSCSRACPRGFYKLQRRKKRGFCAKCLIRGCQECSTRHYCSVCKSGMFRHAGRCYRTCPSGTLATARAPTLCLPRPAPPTELPGTTVAPTPTPNAPTSPAPPSPPLRKRHKKKKKRKKTKESKRIRHGKNGKDVPRDKGRRRKGRRKGRRKKNKELLQTTFPPC